MEENKKKSKTAIIIASIVAVLIATAGVAYAFFTYSNTGTNSSLVVGDIYMKYTGSNELDFQDAMPSSTYTAGKYFEFEVSGKNTTTDKDIIYDIVLNHGVENPQSRSERINDKFLKFRLVEVTEDPTTHEKTEVSPDLIESQSYSTINNTRIYVRTIPHGGANSGEVRHIYRLYAWISDEVVIGNVGADYAPDRWANLYASIQVNVTGDFTAKEVYREPLHNIVSAKLTDANSTPDSENANIKYISGCSDEETIDGTVCTTENKIDFNFVWYSGKLWRITAIYPNGEMKMVTENPITAIYWGENTTYSTSYARTWLNNDFKDTLENQNNILISNNNNFVWNATETSATTKETTKASATTDAVGMLDAYEYTKSYEKAGNTRRKGYLNIKQNWWLITPYSSSYVRYVSNTGILGNYGSSNSTDAVRPSVYLKSSVTLSEGTGTRTNPYRIGEDKSTGTNGTNINERVSGEYVTFKGDKYRIVEVENNTTKIVKADYLLDNNNSLMQKKFAKGQIFGDDLTGEDDTYWDYYLINSWLTQSEKDDWLVQGTYYLGKNDGDNKDYRLTKCTDATCTDTVSDPYTGYAGLLRVGEMFSCQLRTSQSSYQYMWLITPFSSSGVRFVNGDGDLSYDSPSGYTYAVRPTVHLKSNIIIASDNTGDGTEQHPYTLAIGPIS